MVKLELKTPAHRAAGVFAASLLLTVAASAQTPPTSASGPGDLARLVRQYGLKPVTPSSAASDFTLPAPSGGRVSLSDYQGNWVLLTFWATWCGPCRSELPSLETLHRQRASAGLTVLGVSVDAQETGVEPFLEQLGLTFPNLWDETGQVAATYRASSIPLSYLIDPAGRLIAVSRGSRDWTQLVSLIDGLLHLVPPGGDVQPLYQTAAGPVEVPSVLQPPSAEVDLSEPRPEVGAPFFLDVHLRWAGTLEEYLPLPPQVHLPEGVEQEGVTASTSSRDGSNLITYRLALRGREPGSYALDPVDLRYTPRGETTPVSSRLAGPTVEILPATVLGLSPRTLAWNGGAAALGLLLVAALLWWRRGSAVAADPATARWQELRRRLDGARALRLQGDARGAFLALAALEEELRGEGETADPAHRARLEAVRYGGNPPAVEELNPLERRFERLLAALAPDPDRSERRALRLREGSRPDPGPKEVR